MELTLRSSVSEPSVVLKMKLLVSSYDDENRNFV